LNRLRVVVPALALFVGASSPTVGADAGVQVIVNPQVKGSQITRTVLTQIFLKKAPRYADGAAAQPVDQSVKSSVRNAFSNRILG